MKPTFSAWKSAARKAIYGLLYAFVAAGIPAVIAHVQRDYAAWVLTPAVVFALTFLLALLKKRRQKVLP